MIVKSGFYFQQEKGLVMLTASIPHPTLPVFPIEGVGLGFRAMVMPPTSALESDQAVQQAW